MSQKFISTWFYSSLETYEEKGLFGLVSDTKHNNRTVNFDEFSEKIRQTYESYDAQGYDVVNVIPVSMGTSESCTRNDGVLHNTYVGDVGFSITRGAVVIGKQRES